jgi:hypothetical protein
MKAALLALAALACTTPYQRMGARGGYEEVKLAEGSWRVTVRVNAYTPIARAAEYLRRRALELCLADGFDGYVFEESAGIGIYKARVTAIVRCTRGSTTLDE